MGIGMSKDNNLTVIVDADSIVAQALFNDSNHTRTKLLSNKLNEQGARFIFPSTAILESVTVLQKTSGATAYGTGTTLLGDRVEVVEIDRSILLNALNYFNPLGSKKNTLFDCVIMAIADRYETDIVFSFDKIYKKNGYRLVSDL